MKKSLLLQVLPVVAALLIYSCNKDDPQMYEPPDRCPWPEITTEGKHTLGFKINGKEWVPCVDLYGAAVTLRPIDALLTESDGTNTLSMVGAYSVLSYGDSTMNTYGISLSSLRLGKIDSNEIDFAKFSFSQWVDNGVFQNEWDLPTSKQGLTIEILRLDTVNNIASGKFEAILIPKYGTDTLYISEGRFDVTYYPQ